MKKAFFRAFLNDWRGIGSVVPSSRFLVRKMLAPIDFEHARLIIELGPGMGPMTRELLRRMDKGSKLIVFELNESFAKKLMHIRDERLVVIHGSALDMEKFVRAGAADYVVSSIPLAVLPPQLQEKLALEVGRVLSKAGRYIQFQYSLGAHKLLKKFFKSVAVTFTPFNIPPAFIYRCSQLRDHP